MKFQQIEPMKARGAFKESMLDDQSYIVEEKWDGDRRIAQFIHTDVRFTGRRISMETGKLVEKTKNLPQLNKCPEFMNGTVLDGEIVCPYKVEGGQSKAVTAIMGSKPARAKELQKEKGYLIYQVFDCLWYRGEDIRARPLTERLGHVSLAVNKWGNSYARWSMAMGIPARELYAQIIARGGEGIILKKKTGKYGDDKSWVKLKHQATADVVIMGFEDSVEGSKYDQKGLIGAVRFGQYVNTKVGLVLTPFGTCSGFTDDQRAIFSAGKSQFTGQVMEIKHYGREPSGAFRHPQFIRLRTDKLPLDCVKYRSES